MSNLLEQIFQVIGGWPLSMTMELPIANSF